MSEWTQISMFQDPVDEEVRRRCREISKREDWREHIERTFNGISGGMVEGFCWEFTGGKLYASNEIFNAYLPGPNVRQYTKADIIKIIEGML